MTPPGRVQALRDGRILVAQEAEVPDGMKQDVHVPRYRWVRGGVRARRLDRMIDEARQGIPRPTQKQTLGDYLDYWLEHVVKPELRPITYNGYEIMVRRHIMPVLGRKYLVDLSPADVRHLLAALREKDTTGHGGRPTEAVRPHGPVRARRSAERAVQRGTRGDDHRNVAKMVRTSNPDYEVGGGLDPIAARALLRSIGDNRLYALYLWRSCSGCDGANSWA
ncbi:MAG: hypothetical protein H0V92_11770 [Pseudonocardiales bacterium]|nr:hypothetical protein [Pseudonocardiales bacterium]